MEHIVTEGFQTVLFFSEAQTLTRLVSGILAVEVHLANNAFGCRLAMSLDRVVREIKVSWSSAQDFHSEDFHGAWV